ncbi:hypothetical protein C3L33_02609, partial [Rhododendron williamsianum]
MSNTSGAGAESLMEMGSGLFGCSHYRRRCKIRAPCCDEIFDCRHCHNESKVVCSFLWFYIDIKITTFGISSNTTATAECYCSWAFKIGETQNESNSIHNLEQNSLEVDPLSRHDVPRHEVKRVSEAVLKDQYHCDKCGICRLKFFSKLFYFPPIAITVPITGGEENFFHCNKCGCCYSRLMKDSHICVERAMHHNCPVCFEVASMPMPEMYENKMVWILCNDCGETSEVNFHIVAHKCVKCNSYNTRRTRGGPASCSSRIEMVR